MKKTLSTLAILSILGNAIAQPGDAQIKKDVGGNGDHVKSFKFTKTTGTRQWDGGVGNWEYVRGILVVRKSEYPEYDLEVRGDAVYQDMGGGKYSYKKFRVISNQYLGIPDPTIGEVTNALAKDWKNFYRGDYQKIYEIQEPLRFADEPKIFWYSPNSVSLLLKTKIALVDSDVAAREVNQVYQVRFYRDNPKSEWKNFVATKETSHKENQVFSERTINYVQAERLRRKSLAYSINEQNAKAAKAMGPTVDVNNITNMQQLATLVHNTMHKGTPDELKATLTQLFARNLMVDGSTVQVNGLGEQMINKAIEVAYKGDGTYAMQYCPTPNIDPKRSNEKHIYIMGGMDKVVTLISGIEEKGAYINGVAQNTWKITNIDVGTRQDEDALAYFASFTDKSKMCDKNSASVSSNGKLQTAATPVVKEEAQKQKEELKGRLKGVLKNNKN